jgi:hypothetical protein
MAARIPRTRGRPHTPKDEDQLVSLMRLAYSTATKMDAAVE